MVDQVAVWEVVGHQWVGEGVVDHMGVNSVPVPPLDILSRLTQSPYQVCGKGLVDDIDHLLTDM